MALGLLPFEDNGASFGERAAVRGIPLGAGLPIVLAFNLPLVDPRGFPDTWEVDRDKREEDWDGASCISH